MSSGVIALIVTGCNVVKLVTTYLGIALIEATSIGSENVTRISVALRASELTSVGASPIPVKFADRKSASIASFAGFFSELETTIVYA
jgi:hypothetical protein